MQLETYKMSLEVTHLHRLPPNLNSRINFGDFVWFLKLRTHIFISYQELRIDSDLNFGSYFQTEPVNVLFQKQQVWENSLNFVNQKLLNSHKIVYGMNRMQFKKE